MVIIGEVVFGTYSCSLKYFDIQLSDSGLKKDFDSMNSFMINTTKWNF